MPRSRHAGAAALCLVLVAGLSVVHAATPTAAAAQWQVFTAQALATNVGSQSMRTTLGRVLDHTYSTPLAQIQASNVYTAGNARYRRVVHDLVVGTPVKIVALGGVATNGSDASRPGSNDYFALYINYLKRAFPNAHITPVRKSVGVAPSAVVAQCIDNYLPTDADLVLLELTRNDAVGMDNAIVDTMGGHNAKAYELLMRKVLGSPKQPALLLTQVRQAQAAGRAAEGSPRTQQPAGGCVVVCMCVNICRPAAACCACSQWWMAWAMPPRPFT